MDAGKDTGTTEAVAVEEVAMVEEEVLVIWIAPTTPGTVLTPKRFLRISVASIGMLFRETVKNILAVNIAV